MWGPLGPNHFKYFFRRNDNNDSNKADAGSADKADKPTSLSNIFVDRKDKIDKGFESISDDVDKDLAVLVNTAFHKSLSYQVKELAQKISRPNNCFKVYTSVRVNQLIWNLLKPQTRSYDEKMQSMQSFVARVGCVFVQVQL